MPRPTPRPPPVTRTTLAVSASGSVSEGASMRGVLARRYPLPMRVETTVMSVSWIPSEAISGTTKFPFELGVTHYDDPPPDRIDDIDALQREGAFRFANVLHAWAEIDDGTHRRGRPGRARAHEHHAHEARRPRDRVPADAVSRPAHRTTVGSAHRASRPLRAHRGRPAGRARAPSGQPSAVRAAEGAERVEHARRHDQCRRHDVVRARRREPVPAPLDLHRRRAHREGGPHRLQRVVRTRASANTRRGATRTPPR